MTTPNCNASKNKLSNVLSYHRVINVVALVDGGGAGGGGTTKNIGAGTNGRMFVLVAAVGLIVDIVVVVVEGKLFVVLVAVVVDTSCIDDGSVVSGDDVTVNACAARSDATVTHSLLSIDLSVC